jgi:serine/threonine protein kinase
MGEQQQLPSRFNLATLDPRTLYPTQENVATVMHCVQQVQAQLENDRNLVRQYPDNPQARELRNETIQYLALLNDWISQARNLIAPRVPAGQGQPRAQQPPQQLALAQAGLTVDAAEEGDFRVLASVHHAPEMRRCLWDRARNFHYVQVKKLRDTIYGSVKLYQVGRLDGDLVKFSMPAEQVAIKMYDKELVRRRRSRDGHQVQEDPLKELAIQQRLSNPGHRFVMPLIATLESVNRYFAVYPFVGGGELFDYVSANAPLPESTAKHLMRGMLDGVHYCHTAGICHRDISLENFLLGGEHANEPLLIDFGLSIIMEQEGDHWRPIPHTGAVGKQFYMAPEVYGNAGVPYDGTKVDVWSLGICLAIMLTGVPLWQVPSTADERFRASIVRRQLPKVLRDWGFNLSVTVLALLQRMLELDPAQRATIPEIAMHEWFR